VYPETDSHRLWEAFNTKDSKLVNNWNQKHWIKSSAPKPSIWIYNSERYYFNQDLNGVDTFVGVASGFKYLDILKYTDNCKFVFYDFHEKSLEWIKTLKENWDGNDYPEYLKTQPEEIQSLYKYVNGSVSDNQKMLFEDFGGEAEFKKLWQKFKTCEAVFVTCDLFREGQVQNLLDAITGDRPFFYYSNIFATDFIILSFKLSEIQGQHKSLIDRIFEKHPNAITYGTDEIGKWICRR
jgi:hypothetical protein